MTAGEVLAALDLPAGCRVDRRVPKTLWPDGLRAALADCTDELRWRAVLKPENCAIAAAADAPEIQVLSLTLRGAAKTAAVDKLHRTIPYPIFALVEQGAALTVSLREAASEVGTVSDDAISAAWLPSLALRRQARYSLATVYAGWTAAVRRLGEPARIEREIARLRARAAKEKHMANRAQMNLRLQQLQSEFAAAREALCR